MSQTGNDLALLASVNHSIVSYGTFSMWGALLAGGETISAKGYEKMKEYKEIKAANLPGWTWI